MTKSITVKTPAELTDTDSSVSESTVSQDPTRTSMSIDGEGGLESLFSLHEDYGCSKQTMTSKHEGLTAKARDLFACINCLAFFQVTRPVLVHVLVAFHGRSYERRDDLSIENLVDQRLVVEEVRVARGREQPQEPHHGQHARSNTQPKHVDKPVLDRCTEQHTKQQSEEVANSIVLFVRRTHYRLRMQRQHREEKSKVAKGRIGLE
ncbi:hypothetical protein GQ600_12646 [Phytophthora cactorum]|nr:hypothetical protein GQ600_12646 [Phytophthora cactorum]